VQRIRRSIQGLTSEGVEVKTEFQSGHDYQFRVCVVTAEGKVLADIPGLQSNQNYGSLAENNDKLVATTLAALGLK
jgi:hypothetical protein